MNRRTLVSLLILLALSAPAWAQQPLRRTIVLSPGETVVYTAASQIATLATPAGTNTGANEIIRFDFEQYDTNITVRGVKTGEVKLLVEGTNERIGEIVTAIVVDRRPGPHMSGTRGCDCA